MGSSARGQCTQGHRQSGQQREGRTCQKQPVRQRELGLLTAPPSGTLAAKGQGEDRATRDRGLESLKLTPSGKLAAKVMGKSRTARQERQHRKDGEHRRPDAETQKSKPVQKSLTQRPGLQ